MSCTTPPELSTTQLRQFNEGEADAGVADHIARCPHCRDQAAQLAILNQRLKRALFRLECPSSDELMDHYDRTLPPERAEAVAAHVAACPRCREETVALERFMHMPDPRPKADAPPSPRFRFKEWVVNLARGGGAFTPGLAPAGIRGTGVAGGSWVYHDAGAEVTLSIVAQDDPVHPGRRRVSGWLIAEPLSGRRDLEAQLRQDDRIAGRSPVDDAGAFYVDDLLPGRYAPLIWGPDVRIQSPTPLDL